MASLLACQLCGVSFELARMRCPYEPKEAAWAPSGDEWIDGGNDECDSLLCKWQEREEDDGSLGHPNGNNIEHLAGLECVLTWAYSGARISAEEMKNFRHFQCLMRKPKNWQPTTDDYDFEKDSEYCLSGIGPCPDPEIPEFEYLSTSGQRHGLDPLFISNHRATSYQEKQYHASDYPGKGTFAVPFHPECFDIFTRVSRLRLGLVDLAGLWAWRDSFQTLDEFGKGWPTDIAVRDARGAGWEHEPGSEYLAANPKNIPGFRETISEISKDYVALLREEGRDECGKRIREEGEDSGSSTEDESRITSDIPLLDEDGQIQGRIITRLPKSPKRRKVEPDPEQEIVPDRDLDRFLSKEFQDKLCHCSTTLEFNRFLLSSSELKDLDAACWRKLILEELPWCWEVEGLRFSVTDFKKLYPRLKYGLPVTFKGLFNRRRIWQDVELICDWIAQLGHGQRVERNEVVSGLATEEKRG